MNYPLPPLPVRRFDDLRGWTLTACHSVDNEQLEFTLSDGRKFHLYHEQSCCESVYIEDINGDLEDLVGEPLRIAEEVSNYDGGVPEDSESYTWTFYRLATIKGYVTIRFLGTSNGYYSETVDFGEVR